MAEILRTRTFPMETRIQLQLTQDIHNLYDKCNASVICFLLVFYYNMHGSHDYASRSTDNTMNDSESCSQNPNNNNGTRVL